MTDIKVRFVDVLGEMAFHDLDDGRVKIDLTEYDMVHCGKIVPQRWLGSFKVKRFDTDSGFFDKKDDCLETGDSFYVVDSYGVVSLDKGGPSNPRKIKEKTLTIDGELRSEGEEGNANSVRK